MLPHPPCHHRWERRKFVATLAALGSGLLLSAPLIGQAAGVPSRKTWTVGAVMDLFIKQISGAPFANTVDTLKTGDREMEITGIVTTMFPTVEVIKKTIDAGANFIIAHEPSFYNHLDQTDWLKEDDVYQYKKQLIDQNRIAIWRNHDYIHSYRPDGVQSAVVQKLGWKQYQDKAYGNRMIIPETSLQSLINHIKSRLGIRMVRYIGDLSQPCKKVLLMPGAYGGRNHITAIGKEQPDVVVVGEIQEWETAEYIRDARSKGKKISLIITGHTDSEEPGSLFMMNWLKENVPDVKVHHFPSQNPLMFL